MVLNMLTTGAMVRLGKTYGNLMVDLQATNVKLLRRSVGLVQKLTGLSDVEAKDLLQHCDGEVKTAIVSHRLGLEASEARERVQKVGGRLRVALQEND
jgi:N-acetylmuramic acid 6-phosphate etherase